MARLEPRALDLYVVTTGTLVSGHAHGEIATAAPLRGSPTCGSGGGGEDDTGSRAHPDPD